MYIGHVNVYSSTYKPHNLPSLDSGVAVGRDLEQGDGVYPTDGVKINVLLRFFI